MVMYNFLKKLFNIKENVIEIRYFSPEGHTKIPNGHPLQKAGFLKDCIDNKNKFNISLTKGGVIVLQNKFKVVHLDSGVFYGTYIDDLKNVYNENSCYINLPHVSNKDMIWVADVILTMLNEERVIIRSFNDDKIFLIKKT